MREKIEAFIKKWERDAKASLYLDALLHKKIRQPLVDGLVAIVEAEVDALQKQAIAAQSKAIDAMAEIGAKPAKPKKGKAA